jgi:iron complex transport system permease protein
MPTMKNLLLWLVLALLLMLEIGMGTAGLTLAQVVEAFMHPKSAPLAHTTIIWDSRIPRALAAVVGGASLAWSGMLMQTMFRNPLAGPSMLGISSGASLGVALLVLSGGSFIMSSALGYMSIAVAAIVGAFAALALVLLVAERISDQPTLLIFGIMLSFFTSAVVDALQSQASNESLRSYVNWGLGSFADCDHRENALMATGLFLSLLVTRSILPRLNLLLLGDQYAGTMGIDIAQTRRFMMIITGILAGLTTAFCGPVAFIGLAVPHVSRRLIASADHKRNLIPTLLLGAILALFCDLISRLTALPLNTIASALGAPFVILLMLRWSRFKSMI